MKKFLFLLVVCVALTALTVVAYDEEIPVLMEDPDPFGLGFEDEREDPYAELSEIERLHKGLIRMDETMTPETLYSYMQIIDESENRIKTQKLFYFLDLILYTHYGTHSVDSLFQDFIDAVDYIDINNMDATYMALFNMLDKFSFYLPPEQAEAFFNPSDSKGVGIKTMWQDKNETYQKNGMYVHMVAVGSSAEKAGIKKDDRLVAINGIDVSGLGFYGVSAVIDEESKDADFIEYTFERFGEDAGVYTYNLERTEVTFPQYAIEYYPKSNTFYLDIDSFMNDSTASEVSDLIDDAWNSGYRKVIIDLQDNSGGSVDVAAAIASKFVEGIVPMFFMGRESNKTMYPYLSKANGHKFESITILVNEKSASSAEILTDTLKKKAGAKVVGATTYGKGVAQTALRLVDGSAVGITSYVAYDTEGNTYNEKGITPDYKRVRKIEKNELGVNVGCFTILNYTTAVSALEERLRVLQYLSPDEVDGVFDEDTSRAILSLQYNYSLEMTGELNEETFDAIVALVENWENSYTETESVLDIILKKPVR